PRNPREMITMAERRATPVLFIGITGVLVPVWFGTGRGAWVVITGAKSTSTWTEPGVQRSFRSRPEAGAGIFYGLQPSEWDVSASIPISVGIFYIGSEPLHCG